MMNMELPAQGSGMGRKEPRTDKRKRGTRAWWRRHPGVISAAAAIGLLLLTAIVTPLGNRVVDYLWPATEEAKIVPSPPEIRPGGRLVALGQWPPELSLLCDHSTKVAGLADSQPLSKVRLDANEDVRTTALKQLGALVWYHGRLLITLTSKDNTPLLIMGNRASGVRQT